MVRKRIENVAETRAYIKWRCKLDLSVKTIHDEISDIYGNNQMSFSQFIGGSLNSNRVRNQSKMPHIQEDQDLQSTNIMLLKSNISLKKMRVTLSGS